MSESRTYIRNLNHDVFNNLVELAAKKMYTAEDLMTIRNLINYKMELDAKLGLDNKYFLNVIDVLDMIDTVKKSSSFDESYFETFDYGNNSGLDLFYMALSYGDYITANKVASEDKFGNEKEVRDNFCYYYLMKKTLKYLNILINIKGNEEKDYIEKNLLKCKYDKTFYSLLVSDKKYDDEVYALSAYLFDAKARMRKNDRANRRERQGRK